jgi:hypothetical protein
VRVEESAVVRRTTDWISHSESSFSDHGARVGSPHCRLLQPRGTHPICSSGGCYSIGWLG